MSFFHEITRLPYSNCQRCNTNEDLYIISPTIPESDIGGFICVKCLEELALFAGYVKGEAHASVVKELNDVIVDQESKIKEIPNLMEKVIDGANNLLADFVVSVASITSVDQPVQPKGSKANTSDADNGVGSPKAKRREHEPNNLSSVKLTE
jgi:hypothetical protein